MAGASVPLSTAAASASTEAVRIGKAPISLTDTMAAAKSAKRCQASRHDALGDGGQPESDRERQDGAAGHEQLPLGRGARGHRAPARRTRPVRPMARPCTPPSSHGTTNCQVSEYSPLQARVAARTAGDRADEALARLQRLAAQSAEDAIAALVGPHGAAHAHSLAVVKADRLGVEAPAQSLAAREGDRAGDRDDGGQDVTLDGDGVPLARGRPGASKGSATRSAAAGSCAAAGFMPVRASARPQAARAAFGLVRAGPIQVACVVICPGLPSAYSRRPGVSAASFRNPSSSVSSRSCRAAYSWRSPWEAGCRARALVQAS